MPRQDMMRRELLAMAGLSYLVMRTARAQAPGTPDQIVAELYRRSVVNGEWELPGARQGRPPQRSRPRLVAGDGQGRCANEARRLRLAGLRPGFQLRGSWFDDPRFTVLAQGVNTASVRAPFRTAADPGSEKLEVRYDLVREDGAWKIADIHGRFAAC